MIDISSHRLEHSYNFILRDSNTEGRADRRRKKAIDPRNLDIKQSKSQFHLSPLQVVNIYLETPGTRQAALCALDRAPLQKVPQLVRSRFSQNCLFIAQRLSRHEIASPNAEEKSFLGPPACAWKQV